jgi:hypothetical protein
MYVLGGFLALGTFLDSVANAISLLTPLVAGIGTACIVLLWLLARFLLPLYPLPWVVGKQRILVRKPGIQPTAFALGMVLLLWMPSVITQWQTPPHPSSDARRPQSKLEPFPAGTFGILVLPFEGSTVEEQEKGVKVQGTITKTLRVSPKSPYAASR